MSKLFLSVKITVGVGGVGGRNQIDLSECTIFLYYMYIYSDIEDV